MAVTEGSVSFTAQSTTRTAASFSERMGLEPTTARDLIHTDLAPALSSPQA